MIQKFLFDMNSIVAYDSMSWSEGGWVFFVWPHVFHFFIFLFQKLILFISGEH